MASDQSEPQITAINKGEPAPFDGDLYPIDVSIRFGLAVEHCLERSAAELDYQRKLTDIEIAKTQAIATASTDTDARRIQLLHAQLDEANAWYRSTPFVAAVTATITVAALLLSTVLIEATAEATND